MNDRSYVYPVVFTESSTVTSAWLAFFEVQLILTAGFFHAPTGTGGDHGSKEEASDSTERKIGSAR
jgi:hypothetical protein